MDKICIVCNNKLYGKQVKFCSNSCKQKYVYKNTNTAALQTLKGYTRKLKFISMLGGKCCKCGYNDNISALEFNHLRDKLFGIDLRALANKSLTLLEEEIKKCELLCTNCHRDFHYPHLRIETIEKYVNDNLDVLEQHKLHQGNKNAGKPCEQCGTLFKAVTGKRFCSISCRENSKDYPTKEVLQEDLKTLTRQELVVKYGISVKTIRKILK